MRKILRAQRDVYVTDKVVKNERVFNANTGLASSLNLFKLYGITFSGSTPNVELSRAFVKFDLDPIRDLVSDGKIDVNHSSFSCTFKMFDVDGGQTCPSNFTLVVNPLSRSFDEGLGKDIVLYGDDDVCNFLTGSRSQGSWILSGANSGGSNGSTVDYITSLGALNMTMSQTFDGTEDMSIDVTRIVSATLAGTIPDEGFRIAFSGSHETDQRTYFVKRFASRHAFDSSYHPRLDVTFDDSVQDDTAMLRVGSRSTMFLRNFDGGSYANLVSASSMVTGQNSLMLNLIVPMSGGNLVMGFTGSQHRRGTNDVVGIYSASVLVPETATVNELLRVSGSISFTPVWGSLDGTVAFLTGSKVRAYKPDRGASHANDSTFVTVTNVNAEYGHDDVVTMRLNVFDPLASTLLVSRVPVENVGAIVRDAHWQVRDVESGKITVAFDTVKNSTRASSDATGMFFEIDMTNLDVGHTYVIDTMLTTNGNVKVFRGSSSPFRVIQ